MPTSYLQTEEIGTVNRARVLKCRAAAHLIGFFIPSYACTLQNTWSTQGKQIITISQQSFIPIFMRPIERNQVLLVSVNFCQEKPLGHPRQGKSKGYHSKQKPGHCTHRCTHPLSTCLLPWESHGETARGSAGSRTCRKLSPAPIILVFYL